MSKKSLTNATKSTSRMSTGGVDTRRQSGKKTLPRVGSQKSLKGYSH